MKSPRPSIRALILGVGAALFAGLTACGGGVSVGALDAVQELVPQATASSNHLASDHQCAFWATLGVQAFGFPRVCRRAYRVVLLQQPECLSQFERAPPARDKMDESAVAKVDGVSVRG